MEIQGSILLNRSLINSLGNIYWWLETFIIQLEWFFSLYFNQLNMSHDFSSCPIFVSFLLSLLFRFYYSLPGALSVVRSVLFLQLMWRCNSSIAVYWYEDSCNTLMILGFGWCSIILFMGFTDRMGFSHEDERGFARSISVWGILVL